MFLLQTVLWRMGLLVTHLRMGKNIRTSSWTWLLTKLGKLLQLEKFL